MQLTVGFDLRRMEFSLFYLLEHGEFVLLSITYRTHEQHKNLISYGQKGIGCFQF